MKLRILGSGTSTGVPEIGCKCEVCTSADPRDNRLRASSLLHTDDAGAQHRTFITRYLHIIHMFQTRSGG